MRTPRRLPGSLAVASLAVAGLAVVSLAHPAFGAKVYLNASNQDENAVSCGGVESTYAADEALSVQALLQGWGFEVQYSQDFTNSPSYANNWGADDFLSIHSNAGGGHGTETLYKSSHGELWAGHINDGLMAAFAGAWPDRGLKYRTDLHMLNSTDMPAALTEVLFHDCTTNHSTPIGTISESCFLTDANGRAVAAGGMAQGICTHYGVTCQEGPPPVPLMAMATSIETIAGQDRDFAPTDGIFDMYAGQETVFYVDVTNTAEATAPARNVVAGLVIDAPFEIAEWHIYDNYAGHACGAEWCVNDSDADPSNPSHTSPGSAFELLLSATSPGETKRINLRVRATASSDGAQPQIRAWVRHVDDFYEKAGYDATPNNVDGIQTWNGGDLKIASSAQVWPLAASDAAPAAPDAYVKAADAGANGNEDVGALSGSCGCRTASGPSRPGSILAFLGLAGLALAVRRRR